MPMLPIMMSPHLSQQYALNPESPPWTMNWPPSPPATLSHDIEFMNPPNNFRPYRNSAPHDDDIVLDAVSSPILNSRRHCPSSDSANSNMLLAQHDHSTYDMLKPSHPAKHRSTHSQSQTSPYLHPYLQSQAQIQQQQQQQQQQPFHHTPHHPYPIQSQVQQTSSYSPSHSHSNSHSSSSSKNSHTSYATPSSLSGSITSASTPGPAHMCPPPATNSSPYYYDDDIFSAPVLPASLPYPILNATTTPGTSAPSAVTSDHITQSHFISSQPEFDVATLGLIDSMQTNRALTSYPPLVHPHVTTVEDSNKVMHSLQPLPSYDMIRQERIPMQVLYERARQKTCSKAPPRSSRTGLTGQRRPWTPEEEHALMDGLDRVKGPHWSQILALYGAGGSISDVLKNRNQVQLKDKARNLKLFFLKSGIDVPTYLQGVTGELKTRAPNQAAKREAQERRAMEGKRNAAAAAAAAAASVVDPINVVKLESVNHVNPIHR